MLSVKSSLNFFDFKSFKNDLILLLPQESKSSRTRIANNIINRFFSEKKLYTFLAQAWETYQDEELLIQLTRYEFLACEPVIAEFYLEHIYSLSEDALLSSQVFSIFIKNTYGRKIENLERWLSASMRDLGFVGRAGDFYEVRKEAVPKLAFVLLLHRLFFEKADNIGYDDILNSVFWKFLGIRDERTVKNILLEADLRDVLLFDGHGARKMYGLEELMAGKMKF